MLAHLAYVLENRLDEAEIADVEDRQGKPDMAKMSSALLEGRLTSMTMRLSAGRSLEQDRVSTHASRM